MRYFYDDYEDPVYDAVELHERLEHEGDDCFLYWPQTVYPEKEVPLRLNAKDQAERIVERLIEDYFARQNKPSRWFHSYCTGEQVLEWWLEEYYDCCDWYDGPSEKACECIYRAEQIMQDAINWWLFWNAGFIRMLANWLAWEPTRWCIGITVIEQAVEKAELELRGIDLYVVADKKNPTVWEWPM